MSSDAPDSPAATPAPKSRAIWIDVSRAIAMFFIMWLHTRNAPVAIHGAVGGGIALFFLLAGYFMPREAAPCAKRAIKLAYTWVIWMIIPSLFYIWGGMDWEWQRGLGWGVGAYNAPMWFLRNLVIFQLMMAGLIAIRFLPKYAVPFAITLACCAYFTEWAQHITICFDYLMVVALGFCLRSIKLGSIYNYLQKNMLILAAMALIILLQPELIRELGLTWDVKYRIPNIPVRMMAYTLLMLLSGIAIAKYLPRIAEPIAVVGRCMLFIFVAHSLVYGYMIYLESLFFDSIPLDGFWTPLWVMPLMAWIYLKLQKHCPKLAKLLGV